MAEQRVEHAFVDPLAIPYGTHDVTIVDYVLDPGTGEVRLVKTLGTAFVEEDGTVTVVPRVSRL